MTVSPGHITECLYQTFRSLSNNGIVVALFSGLRNILDDNDINHRLLIVFMPIFGKCNSSILYVTLL